MMVSAQVGASGNGVCVPVAQDNLSNLARRLCVRLSDGVCVCVENAC